MSALSLYLLLKMDSFSCLAGFLSGVCFGLTATLFILWAITADCAEDETAEIFKKASLTHWKWLLPLSGLFLIVSLLIPSTKQMATIIVVPKILSSIESNKELMALPKEIISLASDWIKELRPENVKDIIKSSKAELK